MSVLFSLLALAATFLTCETYIDGYGNNQNYNYNQAYYDWYQKYYASYYAQQQQATAAPQPAAATPDPDWTYTCVTAPPAAYNLCTYGSHAYMPLKEVFKDNPFVMAILNAVRLLNLAADLYPNMDLGFDLSPNLDPRTTVIVLSLFVASLLLLYLIDKTSDCLKRHSTVEDASSDIQREKLVSMV